MVFNVTSFNSPVRRPALRNGFTLVEVLVGIAISGMVLAQICLLWFYSTRSFATQISFVDMDQSSQRALDLLTREIRQVKRLDSFAEDEVVFTDVDDKKLTFRFRNNQLIRIKASKQVLLSDCEYGGFAIYQRTPVAGAYEYTPASSPATCKLVEVRWISQRQPFPSAPAVKAAMQSAKIVLRSH